MATHRFGLCRVGFEFTYLPQLEARRRSGWLEVPVMKGIAGASPPRWEKFYPRFADLQRPWELS